MDSPNVQPGLLNFASRVLIIAWAVIFLVTVLFRTSYPGDDPYRCRALLNTGRWVDPPDENGDRLPFKKWQPEGCLPHKYESEDIRQCLAGRRIVIGGDSTSQQVARAIAKLLDREEAEYDLPTHHRRVAWKLLYHGINITMVFNPYMRLSGRWDYDLSNPEGNFSRVEILTEELDLFNKDRDNPVSIEDQAGPALVVLTAGPWYTFGQNDTEREAWMDTYAKDIRNMSDYLQGTRNDDFTDPMNPVDGKGNQIFFVPPIGPCYLGGKNDHKISEANDIIKMQNWLRSNEENLNFRLAWGVSATVAGQNKTFIDPYSTGWHYIDDVAEARANILLNLRCNARLDRVRKRPTRGNCCTDYGKKPLVQIFAVGSGLLLLLICIGCELLAAVYRPAASRRFLNMQTGGAIVLPLLMAYYADRTQYMAKGHKILDNGSFMLLCAPWLVIGLLTIQRSPTSQTWSSPSIIKIGQPFISSHQIDEWKGWMMLFLICAYWVSGDESAQLKITTHVLVSAYMFLIGYEHTTYLLVQKDYSFTYVAGTLLRLNFLTCLMCHFANTDYLQYPYVAMSSFFFLVVWATMKVLHTLWNHDTQLLVSKICVSAVIVTFVVKLSPLLRWIHFLLSILFNIHWDIALWEDQLQKDLYVTYVGMLLAVGNDRIKENLGPVLRGTLALVGVFTLGYCWSTLTNDGLQFDDYYPWHAFASFAPILAYVALRNSSVTIRNFHSKSMAWVGRCHLELYVLQFHLLSAADGRGVLLTGLFSGDGSLLWDRWRDLIIVAPLYMWIGSNAATGTVQVVKAIVPIPLSETENEVSVQLTNYEGKDNDEESNYNSVASHGPSSPVSGLLRDGWKITPKRTLEQMIHAGSLMYSQFASVVLLALVFWALNLLTHGHGDVTIPDGWTPHHNDTSAAIMD